MENYTILYGQTKEAVLEMVSGIIKAEHYDAEQLYSATFDALKMLTRQFGTHEYAFNLSIEIFVENTFTEIAPVLRQIVDDHIASIRVNTETADAVFAAYYALSLIYKKTKNINGLRSLADDKYDVAFIRGFAGYPLTFEVFSRYHKRTKTLEGYRKALGYDNRAIRMLSRLKASNIGVCISFASTVCLILESNSDFLEPDQIASAIEYINAAIDINPEYPKYYYLKAKLAFYSALPEDDNEKLGRICRQVIQDLEDAEIFLQEKDVYRAAERKEYESFKMKVWNMLDMRRHPRFLLSDEQLSALRNRILECSEIDRRSCLPPLPDLQEGDRYFFICYSVADFKSVYSDIIELYRNKVPFCYDQNIAAGRNWQQYVRSHISSENCMGVVFYISRNTLQTNSVCEEIQIVNEYDKPYFCVNLEGAKPPSDLLTDIIIENYLNHGKQLSGSQMRLFLNAFDDDTVFTAKYREHSDAGLQHFQKYLFDIRNCFPDLTICE